jgi:hypothetical protein
LAQKSLNIELRLKSYKVFKFQVLDCKIVGLDCIRNSNPMARELQCKIPGFSQLYELFSQGKTSELGLCPVDHDTVPIHGGLMVVQRQELAGVATGLESSP